MGFRTIILCITLIAAPAMGQSPDDWVYGDCVASTTDGFYECRGPDADVIFTNVAPTPETEARYKRLRPTVRKLNRLEHQQDDIKRRLERLRHRAKRHHR